MDIGAIAIIGGVAALAVYTFWVLQTKHVDTPNKLKDGSDVERKK